MVTGEPISRVEEVRDGFRVASRDGASAEVRLLPWRFEMGRLRYKLFDTRALALDLLWRLGGGVSSYHAANRDRRLVPLVGLLEQQQDRLFSPLQRRAASVQRAVFSASRTTPLICESELLYEDRWIVADVLRYPAAAVALGWVDTIVSERLDACGQPARLVEEDELVGAMSNWRGLLSPTRQPYRTLNRTLMNLPRRRLDFLHALRHAHLARPFTNWLELTALTAWLSWGRGDDEIWRSRARLIHASSADSIAAAMLRIGEHTRRKLSARRIEDVRFAMTFLGDCPDDHRGRLDGLVTRTIAWHRRLQARIHRQESAAHENRAEPTALPARPLPEVEGIRFLSTVGEVHDEGRIMNHCAGAYAMDALIGSCFLFHVEFEGEHATVEVTADGRVRQAAGPGNEHNIAAAWGRARLEEWAVGWTTRRWRASGGE